MNNFKTLNVFLNGKKAARIAREIKEIVLAELDAFL